MGKTLEISPEGLSNYALPSIKESIVQLEKAMIKLQSIDIIPGVASTATLKEFGNTEVQGIITNIELIKSYISNKIQAFENAQQDSNIKFKSVSINSIKTTKRLVFSSYGTTNRDPYDEARRQQSIATASQTTGRSQEEIDAAERAEAERRKREEEERKRREIEKAEKEFAGMMAYYAGESNDINAAMNAARMEASIGRASQATQIDQGTLKASAVKTEKDKYSNVIDDMANQAVRNGEVSRQYMDNYKDEISLLDIKDYKEKNNTSVNPEKSSIDTSVIKTGSPIANTGGDLNENGKEKKSDEKKSSDTKSSDTITANQCLNWLKDVSNQSIKRTEYDYFIKVLKKAETDGKFDFESSTWDDAVNILRTTTDEGYNYYNKDENEEKLGKLTKLFNENNNEIKKVRNKQIGRKANEAGDKITFNDFASIDFKGENNIKTIKSFNEGTRIPTLKELNIEDGATVNQVIEEAEKIGEYYWADELRKTLRAASLHGKVGANKDLKNEIQTKGVEQYVKEKGINENGTINLNNIDEKSREFILKTFDSAGVDVSDNPKEMIEKLANNGSNYEVIRQVESLIKKNDNNPDPKATLYSELWQEYYNNTDPNVKNEILKRINYETGNNSDSTNIKDKPHEIPKEESKDNKNEGNKSEKNTLNSQDGNITLKNYVSDEQIEELVKHSNLSKDEIKDKLNKVDVQFQIQEYNRLKKENWIDKQETTNQQNDYLETLNYAFNKPGISKIEQNEILKKINWLKGKKINPTIENIKNNNTEKTEIPKEESKDNKNEGNKSEKNTLNSQDGNITLSDYVKDKDIKFLAKNSSLSEEKIREYLAKVDTQYQIDEFRRLEKQYLRYTENTPETEKKEIQDEINKITAPNSPERERNREYSKKTTPLNNVTNDMIEEKAKSFLEESVFWSSLPEEKRNIAIKSLSERIGKYLEGIDTQYQGNALESLDKGRFFKEEALSATRPRGNLVENDTTKYTDAFLGIINTDKELFEELDITTPIYIAENEKGYKAYLPEDQSIKHYEVLNLWNKGKSGEDLIDGTCEVGMITTIKTGYGEFISQLEQGRIMKKIEDDNKDDLLFRVGSAGNAFLSLIESGYSVEGYPFRGAIDSNRDRIIKSMKDGNPVCVLLLGGATDVYNKDYDVKDNEKLDGHFERGGYEGFNHGISLIDIKEENGKYQVFINDSSGFEGWTDLDKFLDANKETDSLFYLVSKDNNNAKSQYYEVDIVSGEGENESVIAYVKTLSDKSHKEVYLDSNQNEVQKGLTDFKGSYSEYINENVNKDDKQFFEKMVNTVKNNNQLSDSDSMESIIKKYKAIIANDSQRREALKDEMDVTLVNNYLTYKDIEQLNLVNNVDFYKEKFAETEDGIDSKDILIKDVPYKYNDTNCAFRLTSTKDLMLRNAQENLNLSDQELNEFNKYLTDNLLDKDIHTFDYGDTDVQNELVKELYNISK